MKTWTQDNRYIVWTVTEGMQYRYDLYVGGILRASNMDFETFYAMYNEVSR